MHQAFIYVFGGGVNTRPKSTREAVQKGPLFRSCPQDRHINNHQYSHNTAMGSSRPGMTRQL